MVALEKGERRGGKTLSSGTDIVGDVAIVKIPLDLTKRDKERFAKKLKRKNRSVRAVYNKIGKLEGEERKPKLVQIFGSGDSLVLHKENGCLFYVDVKKVFFSPRLGSERLRIIKKINKTETVLDMFCGVGPFSIPIAKRCRQVCSIDINSAAINLLKRNIEANKVNNIEYFCGDAKRIVPKLGKHFDRIIMNLPTDSLRFLQIAAKAGERQHVIHFYTFVYIKNGYEEAVRQKKDDIKRTLGNRVKLISAEFHKAGEVAPYMLRGCFDLRIKNSV
jgi:tRNA (guanine37-N1)-methyltransferase